MSVLSTAKDWIEKQANILMQKAVEFLGSELKKQTTLPQPTVNLV